MSPPSPDESAARPETPARSPGPGVAAVPLCLVLHHERFDPYRQLEHWQEQLACTAAAQAATAVFIGRVRGHTGTGQPLEALELEHYPGMAEAQLRLLANSCAERHGATAVLVRHRVGRILNGEAIVLVAVAADRRGPAQRCCQELLETLKHQAPFWKREWSGGTGVWVRGNTPLLDGADQLEAAAERGDNNAAITKTLGR